MAENQAQDQEDRTEEPTAQRLEDFRKEGQVAQSKELTSLFVLLATIGAAWALGPHLLGDFMAMARTIFAESATTELTQEQAGRVLMQILGAMARMVLPVALAGFVAGVVGTIVQIGFLLTTKPIEMDLEKINPVSGMQRIFSMNSLIEGLKALVKLIVVVWVTWKMIESEILGAGSVVDMENIAFASYMTTAGFRVIAGVCVGLFVIAAADFSWQKIRYRKSLMMTKQELKQEAKQREGDPLLKARMRSMQRELARKRMMQEVPKADVVVTNPTHFAVALRYDAEKMAAPKVVAKGQDLVAQRIKELARQSGVPLVENVPLARALHKHVKVGGSVPRALYQAVAEVLAYVYRLKGRFNVR